MWVLLVSTCEVSGVQTNNCIVAATAIPAASTPSFPSITSIAVSLEFDSESLGLLALLSVLRVGVRSGHRFAPLQQVQVSKATNTLGIVKSLTM